MRRSIRVVPAILTDNPQSLEFMLRQAVTYTDYVQIDIMDGKFVPSRSVTWEQVAAVKNSINWEAHLMVEDPEKQMEHYQQAGACKVIFHYEAVSNPEKVISAARKLGISVGLAVNPETSVSMIFPLTEKVDSVLFLSVHPGFYGAKFIPEVLDKIVELRRACPELSIGIDGGVKENNIASIAQSGVNEIFVGSAILLQPDPAASHRKLQTLAQENA